MPPEYVSILQPILNPKLLILSIIPAIVINILAFMVILILTIARYKHSLPLIWPRPLGNALDANWPAAVSPHGL